MRLTDYGFSSRTAALIIAHLSATLLVPMLICRLHEVIVALPSLKKNHLFLFSIFFFWHESVSTVVYNREEFPRSVINYMSKVYHSQCLFNYLYSK